MSENIRVGPEDVPCAIAVMCVPIDDGDAPQAMCPLSVARGDGTVVERAESEAVCSLSMVPGRPHQCVGVAPLRE
jgi:hypothetical protein